MIKNHPARLEQCTSFQMSNPSKWSIQGHSKAGERTGFWLEPLKVCLDAGLSTYRTPKAVFISHKHFDHASCSSITTREQKLPGQEDLNGRPLYFPDEAYTSLYNFNLGIIYLSKDECVLEKMDFSNHEIIWTLKGVHPFKVKPFETFQVPGIKDIEVEVLPAYHNAKSVGYGFSTLRNKLKSEYTEIVKTKAWKYKLKELKENNVSFTEQVRVPELIFFSDSTHECFTRHDEWKKYPVIICECTGYPIVYDKETMFERKHTHIEHLIPLIRENKDKQWILIHASMAIEDEYLEEQEKNLRSEGLDVTIWRDLVKVETKDIVHE